LKGKLLRNGDMLLQEKWMGFMIIFPHLSMLMAHKLRILAVHNKTSNEIQISHRIQPNGQEPKSEMGMGKQTFDTAIEINES